MAKNFINSQDFKSKLNSVTWTWVFGVLFYLVMFVCIVWAFYQDWVPLRSDFTLIDGVLRVRSAYGFFTILFMGVGVAAGILPFLMVLYSWPYFRPPLDFLILWAFLSFCFVCFIPLACHAFPSFTCSTSKITMHFDEGNWYVRADFTPRCVVGAQVKSASYNPGDQNVVILLKHVADCKCHALRSWGDSHGDSRKIISNSYLIKPNRFPFDAGVLASAIATGKIDMSKQGLREGLFYANS